ncbi:peptidase M42 [Pedosphaera parvula]|uniref:Peptidase M42 family protein n=1 Tax=Pedosphaera parvula (strain Ellin514) TaxID=320771 RepID=B9XE97_PEDPL|nr:peptidase M42 [Pedosphaera parvula]EEF61988.1 peptidase M42 family protein [Pedosphaera parvula Ellin514]
MNSQLLSEIASRLMRCPAAPHHEDMVRAEVEKICTEYRLNFARDAYGNLLVRLQTNRAVRPFVLAAHLDHPGFEIIRPLSENKWHARFLGGVGDEYFKRGIPLRLMPGGFPAKLGRKLGKEKEFEIHSEKFFETAPQYAVWELEDFAVRKQHIHGRACDDLVGVASILATLINLKKSRARVNVIGVISLAEEIGFHGALVVANSKVLPKNSLVVSLETSRELPPAKMGKGVIIRVGDRTSLFDSAATRFLMEVAGEFKQKQADFQFQRALMYGGTCEATAYQEYGFQTTAVCVALGNYHNCGVKTKIAPEFVSLHDAWSMVELLSSAARQMPNYPQLVGRLRKRLNNLLHEARQRVVRRSRKQPPKRPRGIAEVEKYPPTSS